MTHDVERVLADIDADHGDRCVEFLRHGVLLDLSAPRQLLVLAGPEHGRTIPLADLAPERSVRKASSIEIESRSATLGLAFVSRTFQKLRVTLRVRDYRQM